MIRHGPRTCCWLIAMLASGCVKEISSDERLDRGTGAPLVKKIGVATLETLQCDDIAEALAAARDLDRSEPERVNLYLTLYASLDERRTLYLQARRHDAGLAYRRGGEKVVAAGELCVRRAGEVERELERVVRDLVSMPTVDEIRGGMTIHIVRLDFPTLRRAIDLLRLADREALLREVDLADRRLEARRAAAAPP